MVKVLEIGLVLLPIFTTLIAQGFDYVHNLDYLYPTYQLIDTAVRNDQKLMFKMKQAFFPAMNFRFWQVDGAEVIPIDVCVTFHKSIAQLPPNQDNPINTGDNLVRDFEQCWSFLWTNSLLLNLIPGDILMAMDPSLTAIFYSGIVGSYMHRGLTMRLSLHLNGSHSLDDYEQGFALFLCLVSPCKHT